jgi:PhnB protein
MAVKPIPDGYSSVTPYLVVNDAVGAIAFYQQTLGAKERFRMSGPDGKVGHAEIQIGDSVVMLADEFPNMGATSPRSLGGTPVSLLVYVEDVDTVAGRFVAAGAKTLRAIQNQFYGDRSGTFEDPFGHKWTIATHVEDVSPEEMHRRSEAFKKQQAPS